MKAKLLVAAILFAPFAHAAPKAVDVYSIWYATDTTDQTSVETFHGCLTTSSTFPTWGQLWNVGPITMHPAIVLSVTTPNPLQVGTSLETAINAAIAASLVPAPTANNNTIYEVHGPTDVTNNGSDGTRLCYNNKYCGEHGPGLYNGKYYQAALVPIDCPLCGGTLKTATWIGMHEIAEAAADEGSATFEVGDQCEASKNLTQLECCSGMVCQPWVAKIGDTPSNVCCFETGDSCNGTNDCCGGLACTGGKCTCEALGDFCLRDVDCCDGHCNTTSQKCETPPQPDAGAADASSDATGDAGTDVPADGGCSCRMARSNASAWPLAILGLALLRRRRVSRR